MSLNDKFVEALQCKVSKDEKGAAEVMKFVETHGENVKKVLAPFTPDGLLMNAESFPASCFNDFYKWTMFPVVWSVERAYHGDVRCTFSVNIRDEEIRQKLLASAESTKGEAAGALFQEFKASLAGLTKRKFDREVFEKCIDEYKLPGWDKTALDAVCGTKDQPRTLVQEFSCLDRDSPVEPSQSDVVLQVFIAKDERLDERRVYIEATGPWHRTTWLETTMMQAVYDALFRTQNREKYGEEDSVWYPKWLAECMCRCHRSVSAAVEHGLRGALFTGRRTGGLPLMLLQGIFGQQAFRSKDGALMLLGSSSVTSRYWSLDRCKVSSDCVPACAGTHAHELSMVTGAILGEVDDKAGMPLSQIVGHMLYFYKSRPQGDVHDAQRKPLMPMLSDTLGTSAFMKTAQALLVPCGRHEGQPILDIIGAARQDSGGLEDFAKSMQHFEFTGAMMASEIETETDLVDAAKHGYKLFGAGGFMGDSEKAWDKSKKNLSMACKVLRVYVGGRRMPTIYGPVKTGETGDEGKIKEGKFEADGTLSASEIAELRSRTQKQADANPKLGKEELQKLFAATLKKITDPDTAGASTNGSVQKGLMEMKVTAQKPLNFYSRAAATFLRGTEDKPPIPVLCLSATGNAIGPAAVVASRMVNDKLATISKVETAYADMDSGRPCAQLVILLQNASEPTAGGGGAVKRGGASGARAPDASEIDMIKGLMAETLQKCQSVGQCSMFFKFEPVQLKTQVVAGTNYFAKVLISDTKAVHIRIMKPLPHTRNAPFVVGVKLDQDAAADVDYFEP